MMKFIFLDLILNILLIHTYTYRSQYALFWKSIEEVVLLHYVYFDFVVVSRKIFNLSFFIYSF